MRRQLTKAALYYGSACSSSFWGGVTPDPANQTLDNPYQYVGRYGYYTHYQEPDFGLLQLGVRYYDPSVGRFTQVDPAKDGWNWYAYVDGNPLGAVDPDGQRLVYDPGFWNDPNIRQRNNCYSYAFNGPRTRVGMPPGRGFRPQPGGWSGSRVMPPSTCDQIWRAAGNDYPGRIEYPSSDSCPTGYYKVCAAVRADGGDHHFYRQDSSGYWSNKPGIFPIEQGLVPPHSIDRMKSLACPEEDANRRAYAVWCGCRCVKEQYPVKPY